MRRTMKEAKKYIYILRHCKSSWSDPKLADMDRPLNKRGRGDAPLMALVIKRMGYTPGLIITSPSMRTRLTIQPIIRAFDLTNDDVLIEPSIYHGSPVDYVNAISMQDDQLSEILLVGHNPAITYIANECIGDPIENVPTGGLLVIRSATEQWSEFSFSKSHLVRYHFPKMYK